MRFPRRYRWLSPLMAWCVICTTFAVPPATTSVAAATPTPTAVTIAGSLQSELGCPGDWDPACTATGLAYDANDDVWQKSFATLAG
ncbi:MAG: hypothetical protein MUD01_28275, partial [Chloroflexaceae bacterium]|nr:hypothetical protein [Chloroflexaceae bacterium]